MELDSTPEPQVVAVPEGDQGDPPLLPPVGSIEALHSRQPGGEVSRGLQVGDHPWHGVGLRQGHGRREDGVALLHHVVQPQLQRGDSRLCGRVLQDGLDHGGSVDHSRSPGGGGRAGVRPHSVRDVLAGRDLVAALAEHGRHHAVHLVQAPAGVGVDVGLHAQHGSGS